MGSSVSNQNFTCATGSKSGTLCGNSLAPMHYSEQKANHQVSQIENKKQRM
jgi:NO-binding membrane sensor protein with MHYT domain